MNHWLAILCLGLTLAAPLAAEARPDRGPQGFDGGFEPPHFDRPSHRERPMMIPNEARSQHRRQSAKCMNAYPDDHGGFTDCIRSDGGGFGGRRQYMPMPVNDY